MYWVKKSISMYNSCEEGLKIISFMKPGSFNSFHNYSVLLHSAICFVNFALKYIPPEHN